MTPEQIFQRREIDQEILHYVRQFTGQATIQRDAIGRYLKSCRRRKLTDQDLIDRLDDLTGRGLLQSQRNWVAGHGFADEYAVTPLARACLDGERPWDWER